MDYNTANIPAMLRHIDQTMSNLAPADKKRIIAISVGRALAVKLPLPSSIVSTSVEFYFKENHTETINRNISVINEVYPLDITLVIDVACMYYAFRYNMVYCPETFAEIMDRLMVWNVDVLPERVRDLASIAMSRADFNKDVEQLIKLTQLALTV